MRQTHDQTVDAVVRHDDVGSAAEEIHGQAARMRLAQQNLKVIRPGRLGIDPGGASDPHGGPGRQRFLPRQPAPR